MSIPAPVPGLVIRYSFLWSKDRAAGAVEGSKERPCAVVVAVKTEDGGLRAIVVPITHTPPEDREDSIEVPFAVCKALGLDGEQQWVRLDELNSFGWPGFDIRPVLGKEGKYDCGMLPKELYRKIGYSDFSVEPELRCSVRVSKADAHIHLNEPLE